MMYIHSRANTMTVLPKLLNFVVHIEPTFKSDCCSTQVISCHFHLTLPAFGCDGKIIALAARDV